MGRHSIVTSDKPETHLGEAFINHHYGVSGSPPLPNGIFRTEFLILFPHCAPEWPYKSRRYNALGAPYITRPFISRSRAFFNVPRAARPPQTQTETRSDR